jgi:methyl-accepting chemotaxis protein
MSFKDLKISTKLTLLITLAALSMVLFGAIGYSIVNTVKVTGPIYDRITMLMDLDSFIMPPDLYLVEARLTLFRFLEEHDPAKAQALIEELNGHEKAFRDGLDKYSKILPPGETRDMMNGTLASEGFKWIEIMNNKVIPAKQQNDEKALAAAVLEGRDHFEAHKKAVYDLDKKLQEDVARQETEAKETIHSRTLLLFAVCFGAMALIVCFGWFTSRLISQSLQQTVTVLESASTGDLRSRVQLDSRDEAGMMGQSLNEMIERFSDAIRSLDEASQQLAEASKQFSIVSQQISANSEETSAQANVVSTATEQVNRGLQTVASSTEEMSASIREIAKNTTEAAKIADGAMRTASETNTIVAKLGESSAEIGQVIKVITSIAQKTDLLALNATVEAARAGEVGAGFAVVANEVKELAKQTAAATEDISRKIETIQADAKGAVQAIGTITSVIGQVNTISGTIATAVEEQSATTSEMSRNVSEAARGASEVAQNIQGVAQAAHSTSQGATDSQKAAKQLGEMSAHLRQLVGRFKIAEAGRERANGQRSELPRTKTRTENETELEEELIAR